MELPFTALGIVNSKDNSRELLKPVYGAVLLFTLPTQRLEKEEGFIVLQSAPILTFLEKGKVKTILCSVKRENYAQLGRGALAQLDNAFTRLRNGNTRLES